MADTEELTRTVNGAPVPQVGTYAIDTVHSTVEFVARHLMVSKVRGSFHEFEGAITVGEDPARSSVQATIQAASVDTREAQRDGHIRSADFLDVESHPTITFTSTKIVPDGGDWKVEGDLTIRGTTRPVVLELEFNGAVADPYGGKRIGFSAKTEIVRDDFGVSFNAALEAGGFVVSKNVQIVLEVEAVLQG